MLNFLLKKPQLIKLMVVVPAVLTVAVFTVFYFTTSQKATGKLFSASVSGSLATAKTDQSNVIRILKVVLLDENKNIVEDITEKVKAKDDNWANIESGQFVRVTFEKQLNNKNDITLYARSAATGDVGLPAGSPTSSASVEAYTENSGEPVATFPEIKQARSYKILLTNLKTPTDTFDLKITGGVNIDWITDPTEGGIAITGGIKINSGIQMSAPAASWSCGDTLVDTRDSKEYPTVYITESDQCWMAENLDYDNGCTEITWVNSTDVGWCGYYTGGPFADEGLLYQWSAAMAGSATEPPARQGLCPDGWHLPSDAEWYALENSLWDGVTGACSASRTSWDCSPAGDKMKSAGLCQGRTPCGTSGFNGLLAGYRLTNGSFFNRTSNGLFWSSTQSSSTSAWDRLLDVSIATVFRGNFIKAFGFSMRCIRN